MIEPRLHKPSFFEALEAAAQLIESRIRKLEDGAEEPFAPVDELRAAALAIRDLRRALSDA